MAQIDNTSINTDTTQTERLYPLLFEPNLHTVVWGGRKIVDWKRHGSYSQSQAPEADDVRVGESWEVSAVEGSPSVVSNGYWAGHNLIGVIDRMPVEILGKAVASKYDGKLPLLAKFIDANRDLSIQVHPDDEMAGREHNKLGKSEMWYVLDAVPGAYLYAGFKDHLTPEDYTRKVQDGTITDALARHEVHPGDVFYLPAGRVHAICSGILLVEVQQSSDVTYRIYDYNRPGIDGKPRELHTAMAAQALNFEVLPEYRTDYRQSSGPSAEKGSVSKCLDTPYFSINIVDTPKPVHRDLIRFGSFVIIMCLQGQCTIRSRVNGTEIRLTEGNSCLVPALIANCDIIPDGEPQQVRLLEAYIDNHRRSLLRRIIHGFRHIR